MCLLSTRTVIQSYTLYGYMYLHDVLIIKMCSFKSGGDPLPSDLAPRGVTLHPERERTARARSAHPQARKRFDQSPSQPPPLLPMLSVLPCCCAAVLCLFTLF